MTQVGTSAGTRGSGEMNQRKSLKKQLVNHESTAPIQGGGGPLPASELQESLSGAAHFPSLVGGSKMSTATRRIIWFILVPLLLVTVFGLVALGGIWSLLRPVSYDTPTELASVPLPSGP